MVCDFSRFVKRKSLFFSTKSPALLTTITNFVTKPRINPLHDMDSLEFLLWVEQEAEREMARRKGQAAEPAPEQSPEKTGTV